MQVVHQLFFLGLHRPVPPAGEVVPDVHPHRLLQGVVPHVAHVVITALDHDVEDALIHAVLHGFPIPPCCGELK
eukprot:124570-Hanusia_phi.AAC.2